MDNSTSPDLEKGIARQDTHNSESIAQLGHSSSPQSTSWSIRQLIRPGTGSCKSGSAIFCFFLLLLQQAEKTPSSQRDGPGRDPPPRMKHPRTSFQKMMKREATPRILSAAVSKAMTTLLRAFAYAIAVQDCPDGYPLTAAFLDSDDNFMIYRRFGYLQARLLLEKQEQLRRLEWDLELMDEKDKEAQSRDLVTLGDGDGESGRAPARQELMQRIEEKYRDYGASITPFSRHISLIRLISFSRASSAVANPLQSTIFKRAREREEFFQP